ncbi:MAG: hypothetical protein ABJJ37_11880 [Roseibium sp.]
MSKTMWDPFVGEVDFHQQSVANPREGIEIPDFFRSLAGVLVLAGFVICFVGIFYRDALWLGVPSLCIGLVGLLGIDHLNNKDGKIRWLLYQLAEANRWAFEVLPSTNLQKNEALKRPANQPRENGSARQPGEIPMDPRVRRVYDRVGDLLTGKVGRVTVLDIDAFFWGETRKSVPFWMAIGVVQADMTLAAPSLKTDAYGNTSNQAYMLQMLCAYRLDRDTGIRARLLHESVTGESRHDFQTESIDFNRKFNISIADRKGNTPEDADAQYQALLQALSPATQATLIELKRKYDVQLVIDGDTVFYAGWDKVNSSDFSIVAEHIVTVTEAFAESAVSFKHFVE